MPARVHLNRNNPRNHEERPRQPPLSIERVRLTAMSVLAILPPVPGPVLWSFLLPRHRKAPRSA